MSDKENKQPEVVSNQPPEKKDPKQMIEESLAKGMMSEEKAKEIMDRYNGEKQEAKEATRESMKKAIKDNLVTGILNNPDFKKAAEKIVKNAKQGQTPQILQFDEKFISGFAIDIKDGIFTDTELIPKGAMSILMGEEDPRNKWEEKNGERTGNKDPNFKRFLEKGNALVEELNKKLTEELAKAPAAAAENKKTEQQAVGKAENKEGNNALTENTDDKKILEGLEKTMNEKKKILEDLKASKTPDQIAIKKAQSEYNQALAAYAGKYAVMNQAADFKKASEKVDPKDTKAKEALIKTAEGMMKFLAETLNKLFHLGIDIKEIFGKEGERFKESNKFVNDSKGEIKSDALKAFLDKVDPKGNQEQVKQDIQVNLMNYYIDGDGKGFNGKAVDKDKDGNLIIMNDKKESKIIMDKASLDSILSSGVGEMKDKIKELIDSFNKKLNHQESKDNSAGNKGNETKIDPKKDEVSPTKKEIPVAPAAAAAEKSKESSKTIEGFTAGKKYKITGNGVNLRTFDAEDSTLGEEKKLNKKDSVKVIEGDVYVMEGKNTMIPVEYKGIKGYVAKEFIGGESSEAPKKAPTHKKGGHKKK